MNEPKICVVGLGYVGLPLALELSKHFRVIGFDVDVERVEQLKAGVDRNEEYSLETLLDTAAIFTHSSSYIGVSDFIIVTVPTPITDGNKPDLSPLESASKLIGLHMDIKRKPIVVYESTVYPGVTEEFCVPIIEKVNPDFKCGENFFVGYSPERINPGDQVNTIDTITKVVSGMNEEVLERVDYVYSSITKTHRASSIKVAEAAKVIENSQRDLNIAFVNELALIFDKLGIDTLDVLEAAGTKWNFLRFQPGLVGGHCISVDPYYLTYKAEDSGVISQVILAGRHVNDSMPGHIVNIISRALNQDKKAVNGSDILILGATFKENCKDVRNSKVENIASDLHNMGANVFIHEPFYVGEEIPFHNLPVEGIDLDKVYSPMFDIVLLAVPHDLYKEWGYATMSKWIASSEPKVVDIKGVLGKHPNVIRL